MSIFGSADLFAIETMQMYGVVPLFVIPLAVGLIIQCLKFVIDVINEKRVSIAYLWRAGGFPSVHSAIASSVTTLMILLHGFDSELTTITLVFSILFWYDAMNVRYQAGVHAQMINELRDKLLPKKERRLSIRRKKSEEQSHVMLQERLGHTLIEVVGGIVFGMLLTWLAYWLFISPYLEALDIVL